MFMAVCGLMHRHFSHKPQASGAKAEGRAPPGMCKALHRQPTANEQSRRSDRVTVLLDDKKALASPNSC